jgi:hypothetical protein
LEDEQRKKLDGLTQALATTALEHPTERKDELPGVP